MDCTNAKVQQNFVFVRANESNKKKVTHVHTHAHTCTCTGAHPGAHTHTHAHRLRTHAHAHIAHRAANTAKSLLAGANIAGGRLAAHAALRATGAQQTRRRQCAGERCYFPQEECLTATGMEGRTLRLHGRARHTVPAPCQGDRGGRILHNRNYNVFTHFMHLTVITGAGRV